MKKITLSADEGLIEEARRIDASRKTTLNAEFRHWLDGYLARKRQAEKALATIRDLQTSRPDVGPAGASLLGKK